METPRFDETRQEMSRRLALASEPSPDDARRPRPLLLIQEFLWPLEPVKRRFDKLKVEPAEHPKRIMLLPGFGAHPVRMRFMARKLEEAGHTAKRWGMGVNLGATAERFAKVEERLIELYDRRGEPIVLVGWSLGGVMARELAKKHPEKITKVITMGLHSRAARGPTMAGGRIRQSPGTASTSRRSTLSSAKSRRLKQLRSGPRAMGSSIPVRLADVRKSVTERLLFGARTWGLCSPTRRLRHYCRNLIALEPLVHQAGRCVLSQAASCGRTNTPGAHERRSRIFQRNART